MIKFNQNPSKNQDFKERKLLTFRPLILTKDQLLTLFEFVVTKIEITGVTIDDILIISDYYETDRYPGPKYFIPSNHEIAIYLDLTKRIYNVIDLHINK